VCIANAADSGRQRRFGRKHFLLVVSIIVNQIDIKGKGTLQPLAAVRLTQTGCIRDAAKTFAFVRTAHGNVICNRCISYTVTFNARMCRRRIRM